MLAPESAGLSEAERTTGIGRMPTCVRMQQICLFRSNWRRPRLGTQQAVGKGGKCCVGGQIDFGWSWRREEALQEQEPAVGSPEV